MPITIVRPSIVVGECRSGWTSSFNVLYWPLRAFSRGVYAALPARGRPPVDVVPVDYVADAIFALGQVPEAAGATFHLTAGRDASSVGEMVELASAFFARPAPRLIDPALYRRVLHPLLMRGAGTSATAGHCVAAKSSSPTSPHGSAMTTVRTRAVLHDTGIEPCRCPRISTGSPSSRSPPTGAVARSRARGPWFPSLAPGRCARRPRAGAPELLDSGMTRARLSGLDASFLAVETPTAHMHVGWVAVFSAPASGRLPDFAELREHIERRLVRAPRYRQKLAPVPLGLNAPEWVDDEAFAIDRHLFRAPGPLAGLVDEVMSTPLRRDRPLWELWICHDPERGELAVVGKAHHCMVDGIAAVELASLLLDPSPRPEPYEPDGWRPQPQPAAEGCWSGRPRPRRPPARSPARPVRAVASPARAARELTASAVEVSRALSHTLLKAAPAGGCSTGRSRRCAAWRGRNGHSTTCRPSSAPTARRSTTWSSPRWPGACAPT